MTGARNVAVAVAVTLGAPVVAWAGVYFICYMALQSVGRYPRDEALVLFGVVPLLAALSVAYIFLTRTVASAVLAVILSVAAFGFAVRACDGSPKTTPGWLLIFASFALAFVASLWLLSARLRQSKTEKK
jgi:hypothetical protein